MNLIPFSMGRRFAVYGLTTLCGGLMAGSASGAYEVRTVSVDGNLEHRLLKDGFHFASLIETGAGALIVRPHPDQSQPDGWGSSWYLNPVRQDAGGTIGGGGFDTVVAGANDISMTASGEIRGASQTVVGSFTIQSRFTYEASSETCASDGSLSATLTTSPMASGFDLNLALVASNRLLGVPLLYRSGFGNTGDMTQVEARFGATATPDDETWTPETGPDGHFPQKFTDELRLIVVGDLNDYDAHRHRRVCGVKRALKPTLAVTYQQTAGDLAFGATYARGFATDFEQDNVGVIVQVPKSRSSDTTFAIDIGMTSQPPSDQLLPPFQPDLILSMGRSNVKGTDLYGSSACQELKARMFGKRRIETHLDLSNEGTNPRDRFGIKGSRGNRRLEVRYFNRSEGRIGDVTTAMALGSLRQTLSAGAMARVRISIRSIEGPVGSRRPVHFDFLATSLTDRLQNDRVRLSVSPR
jgi:hypothetical protein